LFSHETATDPHPGPGETSPHLLIHSNIIIPAKPRRRKNEGLWTEW